MVDIAIIDYGVGNVKSLNRSLQKVGADVIITADINVLKNADALVLPGVGAFEPAIEKLQPLIPLVLEETGQGKPLLGICLGYQLLFTTSEEGVGEDQDLFKGLNIIPGEVKLFPDMGLKVPHMGWNTIDLHPTKKDHPLFSDLGEDPYVYFVHSFYGDVKNEDNILTSTDYGIKFSSAVGTDNVFGTQFHPEKSGTVGLKILENFIKFTKK